MNRGLAFLLLAAAGCAGQSGTLSLRLVVSPADDPFADARAVRFTLGDVTHVTTVPVTGGHFKLSLDRSPSTKAGVVLVEALGMAGELVGRGTSIQLAFGATNQEVAIWVGRPGKLQPAAGALPAASADAAAAGVAGLGLLYAGGAGAGAPLASSDVYDLVTASVLPTVPLNQARSGAVAAPLDRGRALVFGGAQAAGALASAELFDPGGGAQGLWSPLPPTAGVVGSVHPQLTRLGSGGWLISGGEDTRGAALAAAALLSPDGAHLDPLPAMTTARSGHAAAPAHFPDGDGILVTGGAHGTAAPAERLIGGSFLPYALPGLEEREGATATPLPDGRVLILGGRTSTALLASGSLVDVSQPAAVVTPLPGLLSTARAGHTATMIGSELLICGGEDASGAPVGNCDVLDARTAARLRTVPLAVPRSRHAAAALETGVVVIAGGITTGGAATASIEIYTPE